MELSEHTKKLLMYGGGAASIIALILYVKNKQAASASAQGAAGYASGGLGSAGVGGSGADATNAALINSATQTAIAQTNATIAQSQIAAGVQIAGIQSSATLGAAGIQASAAKEGALIGGAATVLAGPQTSAGGNLITQLFDTLKSAGAGLVSLIQGKPVSQQDLNNLALGLPANPFTDPSGKYGSPFVPNSPESGNYGDITTGYQGGGFLGGGFANPLTYDEAGIINPAGTDSFVGSIGSGSNNWFGSSPTDGAAPYYIAAATPEIPVPVDTGGAG